MISKDVEEIQFEVLSSGTLWIVVWLINKNAKNLYGQLVHWGETHKDDDCQFSGKIRMFHWFSLDQKDEIGIFVLSHGFYSCFPRTKKH